MRLRDFRLKLAAIGQISFLITLPDKRVNTDQKMNFDTKKIAPYNIDPKFWNLGIWNFWVNIMRCNFWVAKIHILVYIDPLVRQSHEKLKLANRRQLWSENHATSCKNFVVKNFTPEMCFVPKFQQNRTNGSKVKSKKPVFSLFLSHLCTLSHGGKINRTQSQRFDGLTCSTL